MRATMRHAADRLLKMLRDLVVVPSDGEPWRAKEPRGRAGALERLWMDYWHELNADEYLWSVCSRMADECVATGGKNTSPEQDGCLHLREGTVPQAPILIYLLTAIEWLDAVDKDRPIENGLAGQQTQNPETAPPKTSVSQEPRFVRDRLRYHCFSFEQDIERLRRCWRVVDRRLWPNFQTVAALDYLRSEILIYPMRDMSTGKHATPAAWHPYILKYCQTLGVPSDAIDRLYQRLVAGDLTDERAVELEVKRGFEQLRTAMDLAHDQWLNGEPIIRRREAEVAPTQPIPQSPAAEAVTPFQITLKQISWLVGGKPAKGTIGNKLRDDPNSPKAVDSRKGVEDLFLYCELAKWLKTVFPNVLPPLEEVAIEQLRNRPQVSNR